MDKKIRLDLIVVPPYFKDVEETTLLGSTVGNTKKIHMPIWRATTEEVFEHLKNRLACL